MPKICITLCTRQRPQMLENCINSLLPQMKAEGAIDELLIVENDTKQTIPPLLEQFRNAYPEIRITYQHEPQLGIPIARNRCLEHALQSGYKWLAFIDDDEIMEPGWLAAMRRGANELAAEVLTGPVRPLAEETPPAWHTAPKFKPRVRGQRRFTAATNNTLVNLDWLREAAPDLRFDEKFKTSGGSDIDFFFRLSDLGGRICWLDDAIATEIHTSDRMKLSWQLTRAKRVQANNYQIHKKRKGFLYAMQRTAPKIIGRGIYGIGLLAIAPLYLLVSWNRSAIQGVEGLKSLAAAIGGIEGILGRSPNVYDKIIGR